MIGHMEDYANTYGLSLQQNLNFLKKIRLSLSILSNE